jgi:uncharacterized membrane protein YhhN
MNFTQSHFRILILLFGILAVGSEGLGSDAFYALKPLTSSLVFVYPLVFRNPKLSAYSKWISAGLFFCLVGDVFLLFESYFVNGLSAFLIGHLLFLFSFLNRQGWKWSPQVGLLLGVFASGIFYLIAHNLEALFYPVMAYIFVITLMSWQGWALALHAEEKKQRLLGLGVSLFLFSDTLIALNKFYFSFTGAGVLILASYWIALFLIAQSASR